MDRSEVIQILIVKWFKEYNFVFTLSEEYNEFFLKFVFKIVKHYLVENNLMEIGEDLMWAHIRFIIGKTYKKEIEMFSTKGMLQNHDKMVLSKIITAYRPDLKKELLNKDSFIYDLVEQNLIDNNIEIINEDNLQKAWININIENPIPDLTAEVDIIINQHFNLLKNELNGIDIYNNTLIDIVEGVKIKELYDRYKYGNEDFSYTEEFEKELFDAVTDYLQLNGYI